VLPGDILWGRYAFVSTADGRGVHGLVAPPGSRVAVGPYVGTMKKERAPSKITVSNAEGQRVWQPVTPPLEDNPTNHNNVLLLEFSTGNNGGVRCQVSDWLVRPFDNRSFWDRVRGDRTPSAPLRRVFSTELALQ